MIQDSGGRHASNRTQMYTGHQDASGATAITYLNGIAGTLLMAAGVFMHRRPGYSRRAKYEALMLGCSLSMMAMVFSGVARNSWMLVQGPAAKEIVGPFYIFLAINGSLALLFGILLIEATTRKTDARPRIRTVERNLYRLVMVLGPVVLVLSFVMFNPLLLSIYLLVRYFAVELSARSPILYLRSFGYTDVPTAFGLIVSRVATRVAPVVALVHKAQGPRILHSRTEETDHAQVESVPDEAWKGWVTSKLKACTAVIIDQSTETNSLLWEIEQAASLVPGERIILMRRKSDEEQSLKPSGMACVSYDLEHQGVEIARVELEHMLESIIKTSRDPSVGPDKK